MGDCNLGFRCKGHDCVLSSNPLIGCEPGCFACGVGLMAGGDVKQVDGKYAASSDVMHGAIVAGLGWVLDNPGKSALNAGDIVLTIAEDGCSPLPVNESWFDHHWLDLQSKTPAVNYNLTFFRLGEKRLQTLTVTRT